MLENKLKITDFDEDALWEGVEAIEQVEAFVHNYLSLKQEILERNPQENEELLWSIAKIKNYIEVNF